MELTPNYTDDQLDVSVNDKRRYRKIDNPDGTFSLEDATVYSQKGSKFGAAVLNKIIESLLLLISQLGGWSLKVVDNLPEESQMEDNTIYLSRN